MKETFFFSFCAALLVALPAPREVIEYSRTFKQQRLLPLLLITACRWRIARTASSLSCSRVKEVNPSLALAGEGFLLMAVSCQLLYV